MEKTVTVMVICSLGEDGAASVPFSLALDKKLQQQEPL
jgi:hypothetical protein